MRITSFVASIALVALGLVLSSTALANYPASGNVTGLKFAKGRYAMPGEDVTFVIAGTGNCTVQITGIPGSPSPALKAGGPLPLTLHATVSNAGTYNVTVNVMSDSTRPYWCTGQAQEELYVGPSITGLTVIDAGAKGAPRPRPDIHYAGEDLRIAVTGTGPAGAGNCAYSVTMQEESSQQVTTVGTYDAFGTWDLGPAPASGVYRVKVIPYKPPKTASYSACNGKAEVPGLRLYRNAGWVTGVKLEGLAYHFNAGDDMAMSQFCSNCDSIFSPAHDRAFLGIQPLVFGTTPGGTCAYDIIQSGNGAPGTIEASYHNGQGLTSLSFPTQLGPPFWNAYDNDVQTITVTITVAKDLVWPSCNILDNPITRTLTFTKNTNLRPVFAQ